MTERSAAFSSTLGLNCFSRSSRGLQLLPLAFLRLNRPEAGATRRNDRRTRKARDRLVGRNAPVHLIEALQGTAVSEPPSFHAGKKRNWGTV